MVRGLFLLFVEAARIELASKSIERQASTSVAYWLNLTGLKVQRQTFESASPYVSLLAYRHRQVGSPLSDATSGSADLTRVT